MKKVRELKSRFKARLINALDSDVEPTRPSTPSSINSSGEPAALLTENASIHPPFRSTVLSNINDLAASVPNQTKPAVSVMKQGSPHTPVEVLGPSLDSASHAGHSGFSVIERTTALPHPEPDQAHALVGVSSQPTNLEAVVAPSTRPAAVNSPTTVDKQPPSSSKLGFSSLARTEGWASLKRFLSTVEQAASMSGLGPVKTIVEGLVNCIGIYEEAAQGKNEYKELRVQLEAIFDDLTQYFAASPVITASIASICGSIQKELECVKTQQATPIRRRLIEAGSDADQVLECYRRIQDHLQRLSRNANISTWVIVDQIATDNRLRELAPSMWACYNSEKATELKRGPCTEGTRIKVLAQMREWATSLNTEGVYWINGMAGTGKTTIAYSLCEQLDTGENRLLCASFFCSRLLPECRNVGRIIPSIAYQIARCSLPFQYALSKATKQDPDAHTRSAHLQFDSLIVQPLSDIRVKEAFPANMIVVIDALDECEDTKSTQQILEVLLTKSKGLPIRFVVSSRPEAAIRDQMEKNGTWAHAHVVLHELDTGEVKTDIRTYLKVALAQINPSFSEVEKLVGRAGVLFIYAATVVRYVGRDNFRGNPRARLQTMLDASKQQSKVQTKEIDQLYWTILKVAINDEELEEMELDDINVTLHTVVCAKAPLTVNALNQLLKLNDIGRVHAALRPLWSVLHVMEPEMTVTTLHASFSDYLTDPARSASTPWHCDAGIHHKFLAQKSFERIQDTIPQFNICRLESSYLYDDEVEDLETRVNNYIPLELRYACQYWSAHLDASDSGLLPLLEQFLTKHLLLWMEVMNLTKNVATTPHNLTTTKKWAAKHGAARELIELIQYAWRFSQTVVSSPVSQSTPHIYVSMLPFLSSHSPIRKHYAHRMQGMIGVEGPALDRRKSLLARWSTEESHCDAYSSDGTLVAIVPYTLGDHIFVIDTSSGQKVRDLSHKDVGYNSCVAFSPDVNRVASGTDDRNAICVWDIDSETPVFESHQCHQDSIESIIYSHDGAHIISGSKDCTICVWDAYSGQSVFAPLVGHTGYITSLAISSNNTRIVSGSQDCTIRIWDMQNGRLVFDPITGHSIVYSVAFSPNDSFIVSCSQDRTVRVWDSHTGQSFLSTSSLRNSVHSMAISPDSTCVATGLSDGTIQIWDIISGKALYELSTGSMYEVDTLAYSSDGTRIISHSRSEWILCLFDAQNTTVPLNSLHGHTQPINSIDISPNGERIVSGSDDKTVCVWDPSTGQLVLGPLTGHMDWVHIVRYSPVGNRLLSCSSDGTLRQWDAQTGDCLEVNNPIVDTSTPRYPHDRSMFVSAAYSPDGNLIAAISRSEYVCLWSSRTGERALRPMKGEGDGLSVQFSIDGAALLTGWQDGAVRIWDVQSGQLVSSTRSQDVRYLSAFAFSPDCSYNVILESCSTHWHCGPDMYQRITQTGARTPWSFKGNRSALSSIQFSRDGSRIVSGSDDGTVQIWDAKTGVSIFDSLKGYAGWIKSVAYSPNRTYVASSQDKSIRIWDVSTQPDSSPLIKCVLDEHGWVVNKRFRRLIWVPVDLRSSLIWPRNTALLSRDGYIRLKFDGALMGEEWANSWLDG
ncbi:vegetative incompatibility protein HET-E-1, putative [Rhizoctonia solani AG-3 Rhs1AP]|uniref:Vegetative incompatibility protein HET-E-1, putative n=2 Tax=Rhizoctonia solani AG-3 TaxID=1086053 RepID=X8IW22_9AGAM|nr:vegetative incompatibility protein HET-E-1, putative [Rhizoctonia solani AG-3 Rhs1AP]KEP47134.1 putative vegetative incompatibility protein HET-E-1 [Rhizoctonia solani 123E]